MPNLQAHQSNHSIRKRFPGPFESRRSHDGVDLTFDIVCDTTEKVIVSVRYWEAEDSASHTTSIILDALNGTIRPRRRRLAVPGPFAPELSETPPSLVNIICQSTDEFILGIDYWCISDAIEIGEWIATALNRYHT